MSVAVYVYYSVADPSADRSRVRIEAMLAALARDTGVRGRLLRRRDDPATWMEVYEPVRDERTFLEALARHVDAHDVSALLAPGARRVVERFVPCA